MPGDSSSEGSNHVVLVVDDEPELADLFAMWLDEEWDVRTAFDGESALEQMDETVDIVLLDRRMPGLSGDEVLERIRSKGYDCRVVMVTAVDPDFDIIDMGFDDYVVKPISKEQLRSTVESVLERREYSSSIMEFYSLVSKKAVLESEKSRAELAENDEFQDLRDRIEQLQCEVDEKLSSLETHDDFVATFRELSNNPPNE